MGQKQENGRKPKVATIQKAPSFQHKPEPSPRRHSGAGPPAWMQGVRRAQPSRGRAASGTSRRGGRAASGTKAGESSDLFNTFPQSRNDRRVTPADRAKSQSISHPDSAPLDSSLRWNDNEEKKGGLPSDNPFAIVAEYLTSCPPRHSGAGPPAWMQGVRRAQPSRGRAASGTSRRGGRAVSGTKAGESSA